MTDEEKREEIRKNIEQKTSYDGDLIEDLAQISGDVLDLILQFAVSIGE